MRPLSSSAFDFEKHSQHAITAYQNRLPLYEGFLEVMKKILSVVLVDNRIKVASVDGRLKSLRSFGQKAAEPDSKDPNQPKYKNPLDDIKDIVGLRIITFVLETVKKVDDIIHKEFHVHERLDKAEILREEERFGYQSVHYIVELKENRTSLSEYQNYRHLVAEIQVRTILQHAWAEIEHDIQYKSVQTIPAPYRRRFLTLAGLFEIADRELNALQNEDEARQEIAQESVQQGKLDRVEITPESLKIYLDEKVGADGRMTPLRYDETVRMLRQLGFSDLHQVDSCIEGYDADKITRLIWSARLGQLARFEALLLAGMGEHFIERHPNKLEEEFITRNHNQLAVLKKAGIPIGNCQPKDTSA
jgi:putative GTP pyrophosphokinase